jgi:hypothetical protein
MQRGPKYFDESAQLHRIVAVLVVTATAAFSAGCGLAPTPDPEPPSGGQSFVVDYSTFVSDVSPILTANGCDNSSCHGGGIRGTFELSPDTDKDLDLDFFQVGFQLNGSDPSLSPLLMKPLDESAGGEVHNADSGQFGFLDTSDPDYQTILTWIEAGVFQ